MKITHNKVGQNLNLTDAGKADKAGSAGKVKSDSQSQASVSSALAEDLGSTKVNVSERAQDMKKAKELAMAAPDVNQEKVARLQKMIDEGSYKVDASKIADKMVDEELSWS